uniref:Pirin N-terminal domain-containing protein n=1 Tax=Leersia perrieri TaxID=77586 RepID=A0A0D9X763_9ORYZ
MSAAACISSFPPPPPPMAAAVPLPETSINDDVLVADQKTETEISRCEEVVRRPRAVARKLACERRTFGEGFAFWRGIGGPELDCLDPFISLDEFKFSAPAGFHDHPHRGFENVTYMLEGSVRYHDFSGHKGTINTGDVQLLTAGRGVVHAEMPGGNGVNRGINIWINLSSNDKMVEPRYQDMASRDIPSADDGAVSIKVIAGEALGARSPLQTRTPALCLDVAMSRPGARLRLPVPHGWAACAYVIDGDVVFGDGDGVDDADDAVAGAHTCVVFGEDGGDGVAARGVGEAARFVLVAARAHGEKVVKEGPFVMNTREEVEQARDDYRNRRNGFEMAAGWTSDYAAAAAQ